MSGNVTKYVETIFSVADHASRPMHTISRNVDMLGRSVAVAERAFRRLESGMSRVRHLVAGYLGLHALRHELGEVIRLNGRFEDQTFAIAGMLRAYNLTSTFEGARVEAQRSYEHISELAARLPGETADFFHSFQVMLPGMIQSGMTQVRQMAEFSSRLTAVAIAHNISAMHAGYDAMMLLSGRAHNRLRSWIIFKNYIGMSAEAFNHLTAAQRRARLETMVGRFPELLAAYEHSWSAQMSTFKSFREEAFRISSTPLFNEVLRTLTRVNEVLAQNRERIIAVGQSFFTHLAVGWRFAAQQAEHYFSSVRSRGLGPAALGAISMIPGVGIGTSISLSAAQSMGRGGLTHAAAAGFGLLERAAAAAAPVLGAFANAVARVLVSMGPNTLSVLNGIVSTAERITAPLQQVIDRLAPGLGSFASSVLHAADLLIDPLASAAVAVAEALAGIAPAVSSLVGEFGKFVAEAVTGWRVLFSMARSMFMDLAHSRFGQAALGLFQRMALIPVEGIRTVGQGAARTPGLIHGMIASAGWGGTVGLAPHGGNAIPLVGFGPRIGPGIHGVPTAVASRPGRMASYVAGAHGDVTGGLFGRFASPPSPTRRSLSGVLAEFQRDLRLRQIETSANAFGEGALSGRARGRPTISPDTPHGRGGNHYDFRHSRFDITQRFEEGFDPDRIAVGFVNNLAAMADRRLSSGLAPLFTD